MTAESTSHLKHHLHSVWILCKPATILWIHYNWFFLLTQGWEPFWILLLKPRRQALAPDHITRLNLHMSMKKLAHIYRKTQYSEHFKSLAERWHHEVLHKIHTISKIKSHGFHQATYIGATSYYRSVGSNIIKYCTSNKYCFSFYPGADTRLAKSKLLQVA